MIIFSTLRPEQIDLKRSQAKGVEGLKNFLEFAKTGTIINNASNASSSPLSSILSPLSGLPSLVADELRQQGFEVETMVGSSDFKVDVAVVDPEQTDRYLLGILCDGKNYHETKTARDREIVQPTVLGRLNWNLMRVWAVDWYANHEAVVERIKKKIEDIRNHKEQAPAEPEPAPKVAPLTAAPAAPTFPLPNREGRGGSQSRDIKDIPMAEIKKALVYVTEQSISLPADDLKRVAAQLLGFSHRGSRIDAVLDNAIAQLIKEKRLEERDGMIKFHTFAT
jgi:very-short-patch-repair endonuclease